MLSLDSRQKAALASTISALFFSFSYILMGALYFPFDMPEMETLSDKMRFAWENCLFAALPLLGGMCAVALRKFLRPVTLDGDAVLDGSRLDIHIRFVKDTTQNLLVFIVMLLNLAPWLQGDFLRLLPVLTSWFILARLFYWWAYIISPPHRIFGSTATLVPTLFFFIWSLVRVLGWES